MALRIGGALLVLIGLMLAAFTEFGWRSYRHGVESAGGAVVDAGAGMPASDLRGRRVRVAGTPQVVHAARDAQFGLSVDTPLLVRRVEMFQWREVHVGGDVHYELDWVDHPLDATDFVHPPGHVNPGPFPIQGARFAADEVRLGGLRLSPALIEALPGSEVVPSTAVQLPPNLAATFVRDGDDWVTSVHPHAPQLGDLRIGWQSVPVQPVTVVAQVDGDTLVPAADTPDGKGYVVQLGERALTDMLPEMPSPPRFTWQMLAFAGLLIAAGSLMLLRARRRRVER